MIGIGLLRAVFVASLVLACATGALAGTPTDQLKPEIDRVLQILEDPAFKGGAKTKERRDAIRSATNSVFDWAEMARRSLGRHWQQRTPAERDEFVALFHDLLERSYISTIERYSGEKIVYAGDAVDGEYATVRTKMFTKNSREVAIEYRMSRQGDRWLIYDVLVEGVSLVSNYRTQFNQIIQTSSYQDLLKRIKSDEFAKKSS